MFNDSNKNRCWYKKVEDSFLNNDSSDQIEHTKKETEDVVYDENTISMAIITEWGADLTPKRAELVIDKLGHTFEGWLVENGTEFNVKFETGPLYYKLEAAIRIFCVNETTVEWLKRTVASMDPLWNNGKLFVKNWNEVVLVRCRLIVPEANPNIENLCKVLMQYNTAYKMEQWRFLKYCQKGQEFFLTIGIPKVIFDDVVLPRNCEVYYLQRKLHVQRLENKYKPKWLY